MRKTSVKLAVLAAVAVVLAMAAAAIVFNLFIGWKVEADATADLEYALDLDDGATEARRTPYFVLLDSSFQVDGEGQPWVSAQEVRLAQWFSEHRELYVIQRVSIDGWTCYAVLGSLEDYTFDDDEWGEVGHRRDGYFVAYIDTAGEQALIVSVNTAFAIVALLGALLAAAAGRFAGRRIEQAQEAQKCFYENMSHELKTPLAAIRGYAEGASGGVVETDVALAAIERETQKMSGTIEEILGLSRLESGVVELHRERVDVADFAQDCLMPFEGIVRSRGITVELNLASGSIDADPDLLGRAFSNLLSNAVRHAASTVRVCYDGGELSVWNDGDVPSADQLDHLFDRFYAGEGGSTGIGLAFAREIAVLHGYQLAARLENGGLTMALTLL